MLKIKLVALHCFLGVAILSAFATAGSLRAADPAQAPQTVRVGGDVKPPLKTKNVPPVYPALAASAKVQGVVIVEATIGVDGKVKDVKVIRSLKLLDDAAVAAVKEWEFKPTVIDGHPVQVIMTIPINFSL
jgi:protein TonB